MLFRNNLPDLQSKIRLLHAIPGAPSVDIYLNGMQVGKDIAFSDITFSIKYSTNGIKYNAEKVGLGEEGKLERGKRYNFSLNISDGILTVSGGEIQNWGDGTQMDDIEINNPIVDNNQADENA